MSEHSVQLRQRHAFLDAIKDEPENDVPRLVFADWLEEHGEQERAQFIRFQCRAASLDGLDAERAGLTTAAADLLRRHGPAWFGPVYPLLNEGYGTSARGLLKWSTNDRNMFALPDEVFASEAFRWIDEVAAVSPSEAALRRLPAADIVTLNPHWHGWEVTEPAFMARFTRLRALTFHSGMSPAWVEVLNALPRLANLHVGGTCKKPSQFELLVAGPLLDRLDQLSLATEEASLRLLLDRPVPTGLTNLSLSILSDTRLDRDVLPALLTSPALGRLTSLSLRGALRVEACRALKKVTPSVHLRELSLAGASDAGLRELAQAPLLGGLEKLSLAFEKDIGPAGVAALASSPLAAGLRCLDLHGTQMGAEGARALAGSKYLAGLARLSAGLPSAGRGAPLESIGTEAATVLFSSPALAGLTHLNLIGQDVRPAAIEALVGAGALTALVSLNLAHNSVRIAGMKALARWPGLANLTGLSLVATELTDEGALALAESPHLRPTTWLSAGKNQITERGRLALRARLGERALFDA